jgi:hypothetical protein
MSLFESLRQRWPKIRAALLAFHVAAVLVSSFPGSGRLTDRTRWEDQRTRGEIALWAERMQSWGIDTSPERLEARLWSLVHGYVAFRNGLAAPFQPYVDTAGVTQTWGMFRSPQRRPGELRVSIRERKRWRRVHLSRSEEYDYLAVELDHNRMRKQVARAITDPALFEDIARWIGRRGARDFPDASHMVVEMLRFDALPPDKLRQGQPPSRRIEQRMRLDLEAFR